MDTSITRSRASAARTIADTEVGTNEVLLVAPVDLSPGLGTGPSCVNVASPQECFKAIDERWPQVFAAVVIDWRLPGAGGAQLVGQLRRMDYPTMLLALLPPDRPDLGEAAYKAGADGSLLGARGFQAHLSRVIALATPQAQLWNENERLKRALRDAEREVARARQASRWRDLREALIPLAAHQLKNPLTVILGYSALLLKAPEVGAERRLRGAATTLHRESTRLRQVVEELLEYLRLESDGDTLGRQPFDLAELVRSVGAGKGVAGQPRMRVSPGTVPFTGDYGKLSSALDALLTLRASAGAAGLALGCHDAAQLAAAGVRESLPKGGGSRRSRSVPHRYPRVPRCRMGYGSHAWWRAWRDRNRRCGR